MFVVADIEMIKIDAFNKGIVVKTTESAYLDADASFKKPW